MHAAQLVTYLFAGLSAAGIVFLLWTLVHLVFDSKRKKPAAHSDENGRSRR
ncbi:MAG: hypothetical protein WA476_11970 [Acidobacteriaceae bacterium]